MKVLEIMGGCQSVPVMSDGRVEGIFLVLTRCTYSGRVPNYRCHQACNEPHENTALVEGSRDQFHYRERPSCYGGGSDDKRFGYNGPEERRSIWLGIGKFLFIVVLAVLFFLLAHNMVRHRFFRGGWGNQHGSISP
ncbi:MAG: hypothetical protein WB799_11930 [Candidatus Sulfotelmatobacter sp.]